MPVAVLLHERCSNAARALQYYCKRVAVDRLFSF